MSRGTVVLCNEAKETLIKHPAKKLVMDFLRVLITDALTTPPYTTTLIDTILEVRLCPRFFFCRLCFKLRLIIAKFVFVVKQLEVDLMCSCLHSTSFLLPLKYGIYSIIFYILTERSSIK